MTISYVTTKEMAEDLQSQLSTWRRTIHAHPELSFEEYGTSNYVANILRQLPGVSVQTGIAKTGVVAVVGEGKPVIGIRADMDALPIHEETTHEYVSQVPGVMHACGHDGHTAILLGVVHLLSLISQRGELQGTVKFVFQPAEEATDEWGLTGAPYMIQAGVLDDVDAVLALHMNPESPVGEVRVHSGYSMANVDNYQGIIYGTGGHAAYPHLGTDPTWLLIPVLQALHGVVARRISPLEPAVVSVGQIHAGSASNIIPAEVVVEGTLRSYDPGVREQLITEVEKAFSLAQALGGDYRFQVLRGEPALKNHASITQQITASVRDLYPQVSIVEGPFGLGGEDFGHMTQQVPGAMFFLGCNYRDGISRALHTSIFDLDETCLPMGVSILAETALRLMRYGNKGQE